MVLTDGYVTQEATKDFRFAFTVINNEQIMKRSLTLCDGSVCESRIVRGGEEGSSALQALVCLKELQGW